MQEIVIDSIHQSVTRKINTFTTEVCTEGLEVRRGHIENKMQLKILNYSSLRLCGKNFN
jgi:hypothetical protein